MVSFAHKGKHIASVHFEHFIKLTRIIQFITTCWCKGYARSAVLITRVQHCKFWTDALQTIFGNLVDWRSVIYNQLVCAQRSLERTMLGHGDTIKQSRGTNKIILDEIITE